jgi:hypothetical protein
VAERSNGEPAPYVDIRAGLDALIDRKSFFRLAELAVEHDVGGITRFGVWSAGTFFALDTVDAAPQSDEDA